VYHFNPALCVVVEGIELPVLPLRVDLLRRVCRLLRQGRRSIPGSQRAYAVLSERAGAALAQLAAALVYSKVRRRRTAREIPT
jgi:hypothetical protein